MCIRDSGETVDPTDHACNATVPPPAAAKHPAAVATGKKSRTSALPLVAVAVDDANQCGETAATPSSKTAAANAIIIGDNDKKRSRNRRRRQRQQEGAFCVEPRLKDGDRSAAAAVATVNVAGVTGVEVELSLIHI